MKKSLLVIWLLSPLLIWSQANTIHDLKRIRKKCDSLLTTGELNQQYESYFQKYLTEAKKKKSYNDEQRANQLLCNLYMDLRDLEKAKYYGEQAILVDKKSHNDVGYINSCNQLGRVYHAFEYYKKAISVYERGVQRYDETKAGGTNVCTVLSNMAASYQLLNQSKKETECLIRAMEIAEREGDYENADFIAYSIGYSLMEIELYEKAERYLLKAVSHKKQNPENGAYHHGLGLFYSKVKKYDLALRHNQLALDYFRRTNVPLYEFDVLANISSVYIKTEQPRKALDYMMQAYEILPGLNHKNAEIASNVNLVEIYLQLNNIPKAEEHLDSIFVRTAIDSMPIKTRVEFFRVYSYYFEKKGMYKKAFLFQKKYANSNDSLEQILRKTAIVDIHEQYDVESEKRENLELRLKNKSIEVRRAKDAYYASVVTYSLIGILVLLIGIIYIIRERNKAKELRIIGDFRKMLLNMSASIEHGKWQERERIGSKLHTEITNDLTSIFLKLDGMIKDEDQRKYVGLIKRTAQKTRTLSKGLIDQAPPSQVTFYVIVKHLISRNSNDHLKIRWEMEKQLRLLRFTEKAHLLLYSIIQEGLNNIHAHSLATKVEVKLVAMEKSMILTIKDNGKGMPAEFSYGIGLKQIKRDAKQLGGTVQFESKNGLCVTVKLPKSKQLE